MTQNYPVEFLNYDGQLMLQFLIAKRLPINSLGDLHQTDCRCELMQGISQFNHLKSVKFDGH